MIINNDGQQYRGNVTVLNGDRCTIYGSVNVNHGDNNIIHGNVNVNHGDNCTIYGNINVNSGDRTRCSGRVNVNNGEGLQFISAAEAFAQASFSASGSSGKIQKQHKTTQSVMAATAGAAAAVVAAEAEARRAFAQASSAVQKGLKEHADRMRAIREAEQKAHAAASSSSSSVNTSNMSIRASGPGTVGMEFGSGGLRINGVPVGTGSSFSNIFNVSGFVGSMGSGVNTTLLGPGTLMVKNMEVTHEGKKVATCKDGHGRGTNCIGRNTCAGTMINNRAIGPVIMDGIVYMDDEIVYNPQTRMRGPGSVEGTGLVEGSSSLPSGSAAAPAPSGFVADVIDLDEIDVEEQRQAELELEEAKQRKAREEAERKRLEEEERKRKLRFIHGIEVPEPLPDGQQEEVAATDAQACLVCMDKQRSVVCVPCGHKSLCIGCTRELVERNARRTECPTCRTKAERFMRVYE